MPSSSAGSSSRRSNYSRSFHLPEDDDDGPVAGEFSVGGAMLPVFLNDLGPPSSSSQDLVEVELQLEDDAIYVCSVTPTSMTPTPARFDDFGTAVDGGGGGGSLLARSLSAASKLRRKFGWPRSVASSASSAVEAVAPVTAMTETEKMKMRAQLQRTRSGAQRALKGLRFISSQTTAEDAAAMWQQVEARFDRLAENGLLAREDFGECIGMCYYYSYSVFLSPSFFIRT